MATRMREATPLEPEHSHLLERPDGFYWTDEDTGEEFGPFASLAEAMADMEASTDMEADDVEAGDPDLDHLDEWVDPDTGEPDLDHLPHIEDL